MIFELFSSSLLIHYSVSSCLCVAGVREDIAVHAKVHRGSDFRRGQDHGLLQQPAVPRAAARAEHGPQRHTEKLQRKRLRD